jgi:small-conductance mechanosensitive channel
VNTLGRTSFRLALGLATLLLGAPPRLSAQAAEQSEPASTAAPAPLVFQGITLTTFRASVAGHAPAERAEAALKRLEELRPPHLSDSVAVQSMADGIVLLVGPTIAFAVLEGDLDPRLSRTLEQQAEDSRQRLTQALALRARMFQPSYWLRATLYAILATAILLAIGWALLRLRRAATRRLESASRVQRHILGVETVDISQRLAAAAVWILRLAAVAIGILIVQTWLGFVFNLFPTTQPLGRATRGFLIGAVQTVSVGVWHALPGLFMVALILAAAHFASGFMREFFEGVEVGGRPVLGIHPETAKATSRLLTTTIWILALVMGYPFIPGGQSDVFKGVSVFLGLLVTLGSAGVVGHMMSGLVLVYSRALRQGDFVRVGEVEGTVIEVGALATKLANPKNEEFTIPNLVMVGSTVKNYSRLSKQTGAPLTTAVTIGYDAPWRVVHEMLLCAADQTPGLRKDPAPFVLQTSLSDFYVEYQLIARLEQPEQRYFVLSKLHQNIQDAFNARGVQIMSPHFEGQPDQPVTVPRAKWSVAPGDAERDADRERKP